MRGFNSYKSETKTVDMINRGVQYDRWIKDATNSKRVKNQMGSKPYVFEADRAYRQAKAIMEGDENEKDN